MKKILLTLAIVLMSVSAFSQFKWDKLEFYFHTGPVSPEYQYSYSISITSSGAGHFEYYKGIDTIQKADFSVSRRNLTKLTNEVKSSGILNTTPDNMISTEILIGGKVKILKATLINEDPDKDQPPRVYEYPSNLKTEYLRQMNDLYDVIKSLVPGKYWP